MGPADRVKAGPSTEAPKQQTEGLTFPGTTRAAFINSQEYLFQFLAIR